MGKADRLKREKEGRRKFTSESEQSGARKSRTSNGGQLLPRWRRDSGRDATREEGEEVARRLVGKELAGVD